MPIRKRQTSKKVEEEQPALNATTEEVEEIVEEDPDTIFSDAEATEDVAFEVNEPVTVTDLDEAEDSNAAIDGAKDVHFIVKAASVKAIDSDGGGSALKPVMRRVLKIQLNVGPDGVDGEGLYAGKAFFPEGAIGGFVLDFDMNLTRQYHEKQVEKGAKKAKPFNPDWWKKNAKYPTKEFFFALGALETDPQTGKIVAAPVVDDEFLKDIIGTEIIADILKTPDKYRGEGAFRNEIKNYRPVEGEEDE